MRVALVDGYNMAFRAFYGMPDLTRKDGFPTGALHGWVRSLWWIDDHIKADRLIVFFDLGGAARQEALQEDYKANRGETPPELVQQIPWIKEWTRAMGYLGIEKEGVEADDLIAAYAEYLGQRGDEVIVVSADKDLAQLVNGRVSQLLPPPTANPRLGWRKLDEQGVIDKFGIKPEQIPDYLALIGDTSDNIPGLKGVGPKTAVKWLQQYRNVAGVIEFCGELNPKRFQSLVHAGQEVLRRNLEMTTLNRVHAISEEVIKGDRPEPNGERVVALLLDMEMSGSAEMAKKRFSI